MRISRTLLEWAEPGSLALLFGLPILLLYGGISRTWFLATYSAVKTLVNPWPLLYFALLLFVFAACAKVAAMRARHLVRDAHTPTNALIPYWYLNMGLLASLIGYVTWLILGLARAGNLANLLQKYLADPYFVRNVLLDTLPGITTLTQVAVLAVPLLLAQHRARIGWGHRLVIAVLLLMALTRSFLHSERLALLELALPIAFVTLAHRRIRPTQLASFLLCAFVAVVLFFILNETRRTFVYKPTTDVLTSGLVRFAGYWLASINNGITVFSHLDFRSPYYWTFQALWRFPRVPEGTYALVTGAVPFDAATLLPPYGLNPAFTTITAIGTWILDFGWLGAVVAAAAFGTISGVIYRLSYRSRAFLALYSVWLIGLFNVMRTSYFPLVRLFPAYVFWLGGLALILRAQTRAPRKFDVAPASG